MSGLEVIGGISAIISIIDASNQIYTSARKDANLPETFEAVGCRLPMILDTLQTCKNQLEPTKNNMPTEACEALEKIVDSCDEKARKLREIFEKVIPGQNDGWEKRYLKVLRRLGKGNEVEELMISITENVQLIVNNHAVKSAKPEQNIQLENIIKEMKSVRSSVSEEESLSLTFNSGGGAQTNNVNSGSGQQIINNASVGTQNFVTLKETEGFIFNWLSAPNTVVELEEASQKKHPGTGSWFLDSSDYDSWSTTPNSLLWLTGVAGSGKSVLCSTIINDTFRLQKSRHEVGLAFFFFKFDDDSKKDASSMLRSHLQQLACQLGDESTLLRLHQEYKNTTPPIKALLKALHQMILRFKNVYIILDALDESPQGRLRNALMDVLVSLHELSEPGLHILVSSRDGERDINDVLGLLGVKKVSMENESVNGDIAKFVSAHLQRDRQLQKWKEWHEEIERALIEGAHGVFRWVECQFIELKACPKSLHLLKRLLASLPRSLDETYDRILSRINTLFSEYTRRVLLILCYATRPLTIPELLDAAAVELGESPQFNPERRLQDEDDIKQLCPGLIYIHHERRQKETMWLESKTSRWMPDRKMSEKEEPQAVVRMAHYSVREYLESDRACKQEVTRFAMNRIEAHSEVTQICLAYLLQPALPTADNPLEKFPFSLYAGMEWITHYKYSDDHINPSLSMALKLFKTPSAFTSWTSLREFGRFSLKYGIYGSPPFMPNPRIYFASAFGLDHILSCLLGSDFIYTGVSFRFPGYDDIEESDALHTSCSNGHKDTVQTLIRHCANPQALGLGRCLKIANAKRDTRMIELLLSYYRELDDKYYDELRDVLGESLASSSGRGFEDIVHVLLTHNVVIDHQEPFAKIAFRAASIAGHQHIVDVLIDKLGDAVQETPTDPYQKCLQTLVERNFKTHWRSRLPRATLRAIAFKGESIANDLVEKLHDWKRFHRRESWSRGLSDLLG